MQENVSCKKCGGINIVKAGKRKDGRQIYKCKDCVSFFVESPKRQKNIQPINENIECKSCQGKNLVRAGKTKDGRQIYKCKDCNRCFTWMNKIKATPKQNAQREYISTVPQEVICKKCGKHDSLTKAGKHPDDRQVYRCKECNFYFIWDVQDKQQVEIPEHIVCIQCNQREFLTRRGKQWNNKQMYYCTQCNKAFNEDSLKKKDEIPPGTTCKKCGGINLIKAGKTPTGKRRVQCKDCKIIYVLQGRKQAILPDGIYCTRCESTDITTRGQERGIKMYQCKSCKYRFAWKKE